MTIKTLVSFSFMALAIAAPVLAQPGPPGGGGGRPNMGPPPSGDQGPQNSGHTVGQAVFFSPSGEVFKAPLNAPYPSAIWFAAADTDKDGALSRDEFMTDALRFFAIVDRDGKKIITSQDNSNYEAVLAPEIAGFSPLVSQPKNPRRAEDEGDKEATQNRYVKRVVGAAQFSLINEPQPIRNADTNFDFRITIEEWINASGQRFDMLDANKDGKLTFAELPKTPLQRGLEQRAAEREKQQKKGGGLFGGKRE
ncbi:hypothetical protein [Asticcacaulis sp. YBE204]|uniref:hypothetical protein n=1 Tax=Asticcacaulis sp. YBE204 TaxID=1282363 RepID=UPI0003C40FB3|nr:hypothetical protein [Asticcacaulis sp. YBE204]ESQ79609.1 hypothetical protein AEYBE204_07140 [Asticcacaulis sp. YBE204]